MKKYTNKNISIRLFVYVYRGGLQGEKMLLQIKLERAGGDAQATRVEVSTVKRPGSAKSLRMCCISAKQNSRAYIYVYRTMLLGAGSAFVRCNRASPLIHMIAWHSHAIYETQ